MYQPPYHSLHPNNNQTFSSNKYKIYFKPSSIPHSQSHTNLTSPNPNQFSFKPTLIPSKLYTGSTTYNSKTFLTRQEDFTRKLEQKKQKMDNEHFNKITNNLHLKTSYKIPLSSLLTNYQRNLNKYYQSKQSLYEKYYANPTYNFNNLNTNTSSKKIIVDVYTKSFVKLFNDLDTDEDGLISPISILKTIKHIDKDINRIIEPIITELNEENYTLSQEEFISAMFELIKDLNNEDKQIVFNYYKINKCKDKKEKQIKSRQYSFRPTINERSRSIAGNYEKKMLHEMNNHKIGMSHEHHHTHTHNNIKHKDKHIPNTNTNINQTHRQQQPNHTHVNTLKQTEMKKYYQHFKRTNSAHAIGISSHNNNNNTDIILKNCTFNNYKKCSH